MNTREKDDYILAQQLIADSCKQKEKDCREKTTDFIRTLWHKHSKGIEWNKDNDDIKLRETIGKIAKLLARLRGTIKVWEKGGTTNEENFDHVVPIIEKPDRINQCLYNLARGHALVSGRKQINKEDIAIILEVALDSAIFSRVKLFNALIENNGQLTTDEAINRISCSRTTALKEMQAFKILGLVDIEKDDPTGFAGNLENVMKLKKNFRWFLGKECKSIRKLKL